MKQLYRNCIVILFAIAASATVLNSCKQNHENLKGEEEENELYDGPDKAAEFEYMRTKDPATGKVPTEKMWDAVLQTQALKANRLNSPNGINSLTPLTWTERGSYTDAAGPFGNSRPGNGVTSGRIRAVWADLSDATGKTVWVGGVDGGIWKTTDITASPATWTVINDNLSNLAVSGICQDPSNTNIMYFCTGEAFFNGDAVNGNGVFKSTDHGVTWNLLPSTSTLTRCSKILCDASGNVYVSTIGISVAVGLQRSSDGGTTWTSINPFTTAATPTSRITDFEISSTGTMHVAAGFFSAAGVGGYRYTTSPATCTATTGWNTPAVPYTIPSGTAGARTELACAGNTVYAAEAHPNPANTSSRIDSVAKSTDGGVTWTTVGLTATNISDLNGGTGQGWYSIGLGVDPSNPNNVIVGSLNNLKSTDGGVTWSKISEWVGTTGQYVHADMHNVTWWDNGNKLLIGCDGGAFYSTDKGVTFNDRNTNLRLKQFYGVSIHPTSTNYFLAGAQDNGTHQFNGAGLTSSIEVLGGDGGITAIDQDEPLFQTGAYVYANFRRTTDGGNTWSSSGNGSGTGQFIDPYDYDNVNNKVYAGYGAGQYLRWENPHTGFTFTPITLATIGSGSVASVAVSPYTDKRVYLGTTAGKVIQVDNADLASPTGTDITPAGISTTGYVNSVVVGSSDQKLIATLSNYGVTNIWSSTNGGTSWTACDGNLPDMPVYWALFHPDDDTKCYIATETGVWSTDLLNGASTVWTPEPSFPTVKTMMLKYRTSDRLLAAATHGRGLWTANIPSTCTAAAITTQPTNSTTCSGNNATFSVVATGTSFQWQESTNGGGTWNNITNGGIYSGATTVSLTLTGVTSGMNSYQYRCAVTGSCSPTPLNSNAVTLTVNASTNISSQPANATICAPANTSFSVTATGTSLTYQWQVSTNGGGTWTNLTNGAPYSTVTTSTLNITGATATLNGYQYRCVLGSACTAVNSASATLTVNSAPAITTQPSAVTACAGNNAVFSVVASGTGLTYQWQESTNGGGTWNNIVDGGVYSGSSTTTLTLTAVTAGFNNNQYRCIISGTCPSPATSNAVLLTVGTAVNITSQPSAASGCAGTNASFSVAGTGTVVSYQWQESTNGGGTWNNITNGGIYSGAATTTLTLTGVTAGMNNYQYRCVITGTCAVLNSSAAILTVSTAPNVTGQPAAVSICAGNNATYTVTAGGSGLTYQWQESTDGGGTWNNVTNGGVYSGATSATLTLTAVPVGMNSYQYRCIVSGTCAPSVNSNAATLTVGTALSITAQPTGSTICAGSNTTFAVTTSGTVLSYQWQESTNGGGTWNNITNGGIYSGAASATLSLTGVTAGMNNNQYRCVVTGSCPSVNSNAAVLSVNTAPNITGQPTSSTLCAAQNTTFTVAATGTAVTYQWQVSTTGCAGAFTNVIDGGVYAGASTATLSITGAPATMNGYAYRCVLNGTCTPAATSNCVTLTVNTAVGLTAQPGNSTVCAGSNATFSVTATGTAPSYQWQESTNGGASWNNITNSGVYSGATTASLTLTGVTAGMNNNQYRCIVNGAAPCGNITSNSGILTVNTAPNITAQPVASTLCATQNTSFTIAATGTAITYQWQVSTTGCAGTFSNVVDGGVYAGSSTAALTITGAPATMNGYAYRCVVNGTCTPAATSNCVALTVNTPIALTAQPGNTTVCAGSTANFSVTATGTSPVYQWQESTNGGTTWNNITNGGVYSGATTASLTLTGVTAGMSGYQYRNIVNGTAPCGNVTSNSGILTVNTAPVITTQPTATTNLCSGQNVTFSVIANGTAITYQWQLSTDNGTTWNNITNGGVYSGATAASLTITGATTAMNTYRYHCVISGTCTPAATTTSALLNVYTPITVTTAPANATICATGTTSFSVVVTGTSPVYQWQESTNGGTTWTNITNGGIYNGATTTTLTLTGVTAGMNSYQYRTVISGLAPCGSVNTVAAVLTVSPQPTVTLTASPYTKLLPGMTTTITASVNPPTGFTTVWTRNGNPITVTGNSVNVTVNELGTYSVVATIGTCTSVPANITISDSASSKLFIYPSPNDGQFTVAYYNQGGGSTKQTVTIYSSKGERVYTNQFTVAQVYQLLNVNIRKYGAGVYYVVLSDVNGKVIKRGEVLVR
ncbi:MAG: T9SS type A sorting domain-containing protein [Bacteroidetes bacterium]|nr:T9SS type A sorting domain-containing protein [Bacteroidota bacterium]